MSIQFQETSFRLSASLPGHGNTPDSAGDRLIGVLRGEGCGPEVVDAALHILDRVNATASGKIEIQFGGEIGLPAQRLKGKVLTEEITEFCDSVFQRKGAVFCGPGGGRFVYELRTFFDLYCKFTPVKALQILDDTGVIMPAGRADVDIVIVRENTGGLYYGEWGYFTRGTVTSAFQRFEYNQNQVERILEVAIRLAGMRRNQLTVVLKPGGVPAVCELWKQTLDSLMLVYDVDARILEVDNAMYQLIANARDFDVVVAPNMFGDVLSDGASLLMGSRGLSYSGNFGSSGASVFQTGHGAAHDLAGTGRANPIGQIFSLAMLLRETFGMNNHAHAIESAVTETLRQGWRTPDISADGCTIVGTSEMAKRIADNLEPLLDTIAA